ncbi:MAG: CHAD domain-containing protein, partial [Vicinamibacteria bacterium]
MIQLTSSLLERSPEETARVLCLGLLDEADAALGRLERNEDGEALHDFRVALRRLRSVMRSYRPYLRGSARKKLRARLKKLASSTSGARDVEVQISFLSERAAVENESDPLLREGATRLLERLRAAEPAAASAASLRK